MNPLKYSLLNGSYNMETCALRFSTQSQSGGRGFGLEDHEDIVVMAIKEYAKYYSMIVRTASVFFY